MDISFETLRLTPHTFVKVYTLKTEYLEAKIMTYGGIVMELKVPDRNGHLIDIALGFRDPENYVSQEYLENCPYFGALVGRYANRIKDGKFRIVEHEYQLECNNGPNHLHGGFQGFDKKIWDDEVIRYDNSPALKLTLVSNDGDQGYPGELRVEAVYYFENENNLGIDFKATTNKTTPVNLTWHGYFNLSGEGNGHILSHDLQINASQITEVTPAGIPTGNILEILHTPFDFTLRKKIGERIAELPNGYDHNYVRFPYGELPEIAAIVSEESTGIMMTVWTTQPGLQLYTSNFLDASFIGKSGNPYGMHSGFCLETQHFPDSPNNPHFPRTLLEPGEIYQESTIYRFDTK
ncbi:MAG TPA: aldose epimerase family protein [Lentimicrobium sp.]|nr:aldose epimerase family protein [Lentimicrobium sp.]